MKSIYNANKEEPYLIIGHTHHIKDETTVSGQVWDKYSNSGTTGMWEGIVTGLEINYPLVTPVVWIKEKVKITHYKLENYKYANLYLTKE